MHRRRNRLLFFALLGLIALTATLVTIGLLIRGAVDTERSRLVRIAGSLAGKADDFYALLPQLTDETTRWWIVRAEERDSIVVAPGDDPGASPVRHPVEDTVAELVRTALDGRVGSTLAQAPEGPQAVLAAAPRPDGAAVLVARDLREVRAPFVGPSLAALGITLVAMLASGWVVDRRYTRQLRDLELAEARYRAIFETAVDGIVVIDEHGTIQGLNPSAETLFGYPAEEIVGRNVSALMPPPYRDEHDRYLEHHLRTGERRIIGIGREVVGLRKDGTTFPMELAVSEPIVKRERLFIGMVRDITERKRAEERLEASNRKLAEKNQELERVIYVTSHDLRSPLVNIQGFSHELQRACDRIRQALDETDAGSALHDELTTVLDDDVPESLRYIRTGVSKMDSLLSGLLRLSRLGRATMRPEPLDMTALLGEIATTLGFQIEKAGARLEVDELPACRGDRVQISQVFSNLVDNALKYRDPERPCRVRVTGRRQGAECVYAVEDNGRGIAPDQRQKVFEIFQRLDGNATPGEGLGLTIVQRILHRHGGRIWAESGPGRGTVFRVALPAAEMVEFPR